jgi:hypothetical protein
MRSFFIKEPHRPPHLPEHAQWLAGKEEGFWFLIDEYSKEDLLYRIKSYKKDGILRFKGLYKVDHPGFDAQKEYSFTHLSHGKYCSIEQANKLYRFTPCSNANEDASSLKVTHTRNN